MIYKYNTTKINRITMRLKLFSMIVLIDSAYKRD